MKISILSGKGGTGKTTLSVNLFSYINNATLVDTDIEEPNSHLFINSETNHITQVYKNHPEVDESRCTRCKECGEHCNFNAIVPTNNKVIVFEDLCHDCSMCSLVCKSNAITYKPKVIGEIYTSITDTNKFIYGKLKVGEVSGVKVIEQLHALSSEDDLVITDCPPGVSCSTVAALADTDYAIICAEPTPFGVSDMKMVVELLNEEQINFGVVVNKSGLGNNEIYEYLDTENIELLEQIPWTKERALLYSEGELIINHDESFKEKIKSILQKVLGVSYD